MFRKNLVSEKDKTIKILIYISKLKFINSTFVSKNN